MNPLVAAPPSPLLRTSEVARALGIAPRTVLSWAADGRLETILTPGGHRRFFRSPVVNLAVRMGIGWALAETTPPTSPRAGDLSSFAAAHAAITREAAR